MELEKLVGTLNSIDDVGGSKVSSSRQEEDFVANIWEKWVIFVVAPHLLYGISAITH